MALAAGSAVLGATKSRAGNRLAYDVANKLPANATVAANDVIVTYDTSADYAASYSLVSDVILASGGGTAGTVAASKAVVVDANKDISSFRNLTATTLTGNIRITVNPDVAAAGTVLADAAQLLEGFQVVTGADGTKGVKLPATPTAGTLVWIKGTTAGVLKVWPDAAATINAIGSNGAISLTTGAMPSLFIAKSATQWYTLPLVAS